MNKSPVAAARLCLGLILATLLAACTSQSAKETVTKEKEKDEEYVYRTSIGSRIPVRVKKSEAQTSAETTSRDQRWLSEAQASGVTPPSDPTAGR